MTGPIAISPDRPMVQALGDSAVLVRFGSRLDEMANRRAIAFVRDLASAEIAGVLEVVPSLVSVLLRYDPLRTRYADLAGHIRLALQGLADEVGGGERAVAIRFDGPDLDEVAAALKLSPDAFVCRHNERPLRVLATGFAPGFVYCGFHDEALVLPRRSAVRPLVKAGAVLFAAGQTAIAATDIPTGWHVIGQTDFANFDPQAEPPTLLRAGDMIRFGAL